MSKHWTEKDDAFLMAYHQMDANYVASHDLGKGPGAGVRRMKKLRKSGAFLAFAKMRLAQLQYDLVSGHARGAERRMIIEDDIWLWSNVIREEGK